MFLSPQSQYVACAECGACVPRSDADEHVCDRERWLDYQLARCRPAIDRFESDVHDWLTTLEGQFEDFYAVYSRPRGPLSGAPNATRSHA